MLGRTIGNYQITALVGRGGKGEVYRAEHQSRAGIRAAIKKAAPDVVEEWKWRGVPARDRDGETCNGGSYKSTA